MAKPNKVTQRDKKIATKIKKHRKLKGMTQEQLARKIRVSTTYIGYLEICYRKPNIEMLSRIASALNVKMKDLIP